MFITVERSCSEGGDLAEFGAHQFVSCLVSLMKGGSSSINKARRRNTAVIARSPKNIYLSRCFERQVVSMIIVGFGCRPSRSAASEHHQQVLQLAVANVHLFFVFSLLFFLFLSVDSAAADGYDEVCCDSSSFDCFTSCNSTCCYCCCCCLSATSRVGL